MDEGQKYKVAYCSETLKTLIQKSFGGMESEPMLTPKGKIPSTGKKPLSSEEDQTNNTASSRTVSPTHYQRATLAPD